MNNPHFLILLLIAACVAIADAALAQDDIAGGVQVSSETEQRISALLEAPDIQSSLDHIRAMESQLHDDLIELTEIPAPPFGEEKRGIRFAEMLREAGLADVTIDAVGNVIGRRPGRSGSKVVAYVAHLDTVFPLETDVTVRVEGDTYYAPGVGDNTRGLVVLLGVLRALEHNSIETDADILFIGNVGEEGLGDLRGTKHLFRDGGPQIDSFIAVDGGDAERIVYAGVGSHRYRVTFKGPGGHSWGAFGMANPHHALGRAIATFVENAPSVTSTEPKTSYNVGRIGGGTSINSVPFESWAEIDMRSGDQGKLDDIDAVLQSAVQEALVEENLARLSGPKLTVDVERVGTRPAARNDSNAHLVEIAAATFRQFGIEPALKISSTDANLPISLGIPAITMSRGGDSRNSHSPDESWRNDKGYLGIQVGMITLLAEAGYAGSAQ
jgi:acetylornithine deacetylase/succinyl-diaminopimelate desuccinylase-like protein